MLRVSRSCHLSPPALPHPGAGTVASLWAAPASTSAPLGSPLPHPAGCSPGRQRAQASTCVGPPRAAAARAPTSLGAEPKSSPRPPRPCTTVPGSPCPVRLLALPRSLCSRHTRHLAGTQRNAGVRCSSPGLFFGGTCPGAAAPLILLKPLPGHSPSPPWALPLGSYPSHPGHTHLFIVCPSASRGASEPGLVPGPRST